MFDMSRWLLCIWLSGFLLLIGYVLTFADMKFVHKNVSCLGRRFSTLTRAKRSTLFTVTYSILNHLLMIHIYNEDLNKINIKLITNRFIKVKESKINTFGLY